MQFDELINAESFLNATTTMHLESFRLMLRSYRNIVSLALGILLLGGVLLLPLEARAQVPEDFDMGGFQACYELSGATEASADACYRLQTGEEITPEIRTLLTNEIAQSYAERGGCGWLDLGCHLEKFFGFLLVQIGTGIVGLGWGIAALAGALFDFLVFSTIVQFGQTITNLGLSAGISDVWGTLRDIANILIIGMFVFVAISTILSVNDYGIRRMIARLLIVAILINFSLFFAKFIIDISHFVAIQFYEQHEVLQVSEGDPGYASETDIPLSQQGIAAQFMQALGIVSVADVSGGLYAVKDAQNGGLGAVLLFSLLTFVLLVGLALVLFYGSFVLASRAILLVLVMLTSALAFASHLIPPKIRLRYGWKEWWDALVRAALLAPLLMIFLWASIKVLERAAQGAVGVEAGTGATSGAATGFGAFIQNPTSTDGLGSVFLLYVLVLGLLYVSIRLASSMSSSIAGFNIAATIPGLGVALGSRATGRLGRGVAGWNQRRMQRQAEEEARRDRAAGGKGEISERTARRLQRANTLAGMSFDPMANKALQNLVRSTALPKGVADKLTKPQKGGAAATRKAALEKEQGQVQLKADIEGKVVKEERDRLAKEAQASAEVVERTQQPEKNAGVAEQAQLTSQLKRIEEQIADKKRELDIADSQDEKRRIKGEWDELVNRQRQVNRDYEAADTRIKGAEKIVAAAQKEAQEAKKRAGENATAQAAERIAKEGPRNFGSWLRRREHGISNEELAKSMRGKAAAEGSKKRFKELFGEDVDKIVKESNKEGGDES